MALKHVLAQPAPGTAADPDGPPQLVRQFSREPTKKALLWQMPLDTLPISLHVGMAGTSDAVTTLQRGHRSVLGDAPSAGTAECSRANADALARGERVPTVALHPRDMLRLATLDGARVWGLQDEIGSLGPGKQADIETVIVGGDIVKRNGHLVGAHVNAARTLMHEARQRLLHRDETGTTSDTLHAIA